MRSGQLMKADSLALRIRTAITAFNSAELRATDGELAKSLWDKVRLFTSSATRSSTCPAITPDQFNMHYAAISTDSAYALPLPKQTCARNFQLFHPYSVYRTLDSLKPTSFGLDGLPE